MTGTPGRYIPTEDHATRHQALAPAATALAPAQRTPDHDTDRAPAPRADLGSVLLQLQRSHGNHYVQRLVDQGRSVPGTRIPDGIRTALERRSGADLSGVRVHYNSPRPATLNADAYTQGEEIHVAPGQERHLAHEAWHVVQQRQGRVRATHAEAGVALNEDGGLEREADHARQASLAAPTAPARSAAGPSAASYGQPSHPAPVQLHRVHVSNRLLKYRSKTMAISEADWEKLLVIFAKWEEWEEKADKCGGKFPAKTWRYNAEVMVTKDLIETVNSSNDISLPVRRILVRLWNEGTAPAAQVVFTEPALTEAETVNLEPGVLRSWEPLSPYADRFKYDPMEEFGLVPEPEPESPPEKKSKKKKKSKDKSKSKRRSEGRKKSKSRKKSESESGSEEERQSKPVIEKRPRAEEDTGKEPKKQRRRSRKLANATGTKAQEDVPFVGTVQEAAVTIRSFAKQETPIPPGFKLMWGPGMFEKRSLEDIVYTLLTETESGGTFVRVGNVDSWDAILRQIPERYLKNPARFLHALQAVLRGQQTNDRVLALVAGAMICDAKHGVREWIQVLSELYPMLTELPSGTDLPTLFKKWYEYSGRGGRDLRGRERRPSYRDQPSRVKTPEWQLPTLIPSRGGYNFPDPGMPEFYHQNRALQIVLGEAGDPAMLWEFAMANKFLYNLLAARYRKWYGPKLT